MIKLVYKLQQHIKYTDTAYILYTPHSLLAHDNLFAVSYS